MGLSHMSRQHVWNMTYVSLMEHDLREFNYSLQPESMQDEYMTLVHRPYVSFLYFNELRWLAKCQTSAASPIGHI